MMHREGFLLTQSASLPGSSGQSITRRMDYPDKPGNDGLRGFSLVELSIVLVILGLLTGGILTGQNLIRASEIRKVAKDVEQYRIATMSFRDRYFALPGDMSNATDFWELQNGSCADPSTTGNGTCNGDGNGSLTAINWIYDHYESFRFWQHLQLAGLISGNYTGARHNSDHGFAQSGLNSPTAPGAGADAIFFADNAINPDLFFSSAINKDILTYRKDNNSHGSDNGVWTTEEAYLFDQKYDDGYPHAGAITSYKRYSNWATRECVTDNSNPEYQISWTNGTRCLLHFAIR